MTGFFNKSQILGPSTRLVLKPKALAVQERVAAKRKAMDRSEQGANPEWSKFMLELVQSTCTEMPIINSDDVFERHALIPNAPTTHDPRAFGPVMRRAAKLGYCRNTGDFVKSRRSSNNRRPIENWESLIYKGK